jgi:hypothetical protein
MNIWAMIQNGVVVNTVLASPTDFKDPNYIWVNITAYSPMPGIGWTYDGSNFTQP